MATLRKRTVKTSGGDYTSLAAWEAGEQADLVALDEIRQAECYAMLDLSVPTFAGWTTDATRYIHVIVPASDRHLGKPDSTSYRLASDSFSWAATVQVANTIFEGVQFLTGSNGNPQGGIRYNSAINYGTGNEVRECVFDWRSTPPPYASVMVDGATGGTFKVRNSSHAPGAGITDFVKHNAGSGFTTYAYNLSSYSTYTGGFGRTYNQNSVGTLVCKNCVGAYQTASSNSVFNGTVGGDHNCSSDATAPGTGSKTNQTPSFVSTANGDLHLAGGDTVAQGAGANLSADANYAFAIDIDALGRGATWDMGADQVTASGSSQDLAGGATGHGTASGAAAVTKPLAGGAAGQAAATGALDHGVPLAGGATGQGAATGTLLGGATITSNALKNDSGSLLASTTIPKLAALRVSDLALIASWTNQATNGAGVLALFHTSLVAGTAYLLVSCNADGSAHGAEVYTAA